MARSSVMLRTAAVLLAFAGALCALAPAAAQARCRDGARAVMTSPESSRTIRTAVLVCQDGRERVVRRATLRGGSPRRGAYLSDAELRAGRLAVGSIAFATRNEARHTVEVTSLQTGRILFERVLRERASSTVPDVEVALTAVGDIAWTASRDLYVRGADLFVLRVRTPEASDLAIEGDRTLRWKARGITRRRDLSRRDGCPVRPGYEPSGPDAGGLRVTRAGQSGGVWWRACVVGGGRDVPLGVGTARAPLLVLARATPSVLVRGGESATCPERAVRVVDATTGRSLREAPCSPDPVLPTFRSPAALTPAGAAAWVRDGVLRGLAADGALVELDRGAITALRADGEELRWRRDGMDRAARL